MYIECSPYTYSSMFCSVVQASAEWMRVVCNRPIRCSLQTLLQLSSRSTSHLPLYALHMLIICCEMSNNNGCFHMAYVVFDFLRSSISRIRWLGYDTRSAQ